MMTRRFQQSSSFHCMVWQESNPLTFRRSLLMPRRRTKSISESARASDAFLQFSELTRSRVYHFATGNLNPAACQSWVGVDCNVPYIYLLNTASPGANL
jgi:hypothetical protein